LSSAILINIKCCQLLQTEDILLDYHDSSQKTRTIGANKCKQYFIEKPRKLFSVYVENVIISLGRLLSM